eukprot:CAMPEP_0195643300 /NCGR_PEP_ID=MMETSP0815-20121206/27760_1 /TAXON_ID=97485 /ORGANISM="Prymnesium parvum, Strain Texoma1" /LENGTH=32 /DNA_ID= /DNA_START= /DNA_END= /DNA_ORIENTATION=
MTSVVLQTKIPFPRAEQDRSFNTSLASLTAQH